MLDLVTFSSRIDRIENVNIQPTLPCLMHLPHHPRLQPLTPAPAPLDENRIGAGGEEVAVQGRKHLLQIEE